MTGVSFTPASSPAAVGAIGSSVDISGSSCAGGRGVWRITGAKMNNMHVAAAVPTS